MTQLDVQGLVLLWSMPREKRCFLILVSIVILRAQMWNGLPNLTCCKGKLIAVQIVKSNQSTAAISVSN